MQKRKRLLNRKEQAFHIGIENQSKNSSVTVLRRRKLHNTGICEQDIEPARHRV